MCGDYCIQDTLSSRAALGMPLGRVRRASKGILHTTGAEEIPTAETRAAEIYATEIPAAEMRAAETCTAEIYVAGLHAAETRAAEMNAAEMPAADTRARRDDKIS